MSPLNLSWWSGLAMILGGVLLLASDLLVLFIFEFENFSQAAITGRYAFIAVLSLLAAPLFMLGLVGLYTSQAETAGRLGLLAFLVAFIGTALVTGAFWSQAFFVPAVAEAAPDFIDNEQSGWLNFGFLVSFSLFALGWLLFGVATFRARVHPHWAAMLLSIGAVLIALALPLPSLVFNVAAAWLGFNLLTRRGTPAE